MAIEHGYYRDWRFGSGSLEYQKVATSSNVCELMLIE